MTVRGAGLLGMTLGAVLAAFGGLLPAWADGDSASHVVRVQVLYLDAPTDWCAADQGVPVIASLEGMKGELESPRATGSVRVRRGNKSEWVETTSVQSSEVRTHHGTNTITQLRRYPLPPRDVVEGVLHLELRGCQTPWSNGLFRGTWSLHDTQGNVVESGAAPQASFYMQHAFVRASRPFPQTFLLGHRLFIVRTKPDIQSTLEAFASPDKEQSQ